MRNNILKDRTIELIPFTDEDIELVMAWRSHPDVYRYFYRQNQPLTWDDHYRFWTSRQDRVDWIINYIDGEETRKVGGINASDLSTDTPLIGVFIGEITLMGKGIGTKSVNLVVKWLRAQGHVRIHAYVSKENIPSQHLFKSLGFEICGEIHDEKEWIFEKLLD